MKVLVDSSAWLPKAELTEDQIVKLKDALTIFPRKTSDQGEDPSPVPLYQEEDDFIGVPRSYFMERRRDRHQVELRLSEGDFSTWPGPLLFDGKLREEQQRALDEVLPKLRGGLLGGIIRAKPGWGKTVASCALMAELQVPTLIIVHKEFLKDQWIERMQQFLPGIQIGEAQGPVCDYVGKHAVIGMVHSLSTRDRYPQSFYKWPGLVLTDETHRIGAATWAPVPAMFPARFRIGVTATPRRKDGAENVFFYHIGRILFTSHEQRLTPRIRRVWSNFRFPSSKNFNPNVISRSILVNILVKSRARNRLITDQTVLAVKAGRKILVLSERLEHLSQLEKLIKEEMGEEAPSIGYYVGGMSKKERKEAETKQVILATSQYAREGMDIPPLDTLFLTTPLSDVEQAVGRILRPAPGKKEPIVVDLRDDKVAKFRRNGEARDRYYKSIGANV